MLPSLHIDTVYPLNSHTHTPSHLTAHSSHTVINRPFSMWPQRVVAKRGSELYDNHCIQLSMSSMYVAVFLGTGHSTPLTLVMGCQGYTTLPSYITSGIL